MKPHQETWRREHLLVVVDEGDGYDLGASCFGSGALPFANHDADIARLSLAAQAPAMARLLIRVLNRVNDPLATEVSDVLDAAGVIKVERFTMVLE